VTRFRQLEDHAMPKKTVSGWEITYTVKSVTVTKHASVDSYGDQTNAKACVNGLKATAGWTCGFEVTQKNKKADPVVRVNGFGYPLIDKHPGHVEGKGWKYNVELGNGSVDRLVVAPATAEVEMKSFTATPKKITVEVEISCGVKILEDTH
jgi:hypothetical protein